MANNPYDVIVIGSGFAGGVLAERFAGVLGRRVLVVEKRNHIAGNMYDYRDASGVLVHKYGPHIFRTDDEKVWGYLNGFCSFNSYQHRVLANVDGALLPVPFNLTSVERIFPGEKAERLKKTLLSAFGEGAKVPVSELKAHADPELAALGDFIFRKIYLNYTVKQWGESPEKLDFETITRRVPVHVSYDDRYFQHRHQGLPWEGYTRLFEKMLAHKNISVRLGVDARGILKLDEARKEILFEGAPFGGLVVYTGAVDELFGYKFGRLPYRALDFTFRTMQVDRFQPVGTVNYPNEHDYTRITEYKHLTCQEIPGVTTIAEEYPLTYDQNAQRGNEPYYPIPAASNQECYGRYAALAASFANLFLIGRLAEYRYYDMNDIIIRALAAFEELKAR